MAENDGNPEVLAHDRRSGVNGGSVHTSNMNTWETIDYEHYPEGITCMCFCGVRGVLYGVGGKEGNNETPKCYEFNRSTATWEERAPMRNARFNASAAVLEGTMMVVGGMVGDNGLKVCERYTIDTDVWRDEPDLLAPLEKPLVAVAAGKLYVLPAELSGSVKMQQFETRENKFTFTPNGKPKVGNTEAASLVSAGEKLYLFVVYMEKVAVHCYNPSSTQWTLIDSNSPSRYSYSGCSAIAPGGKGKILVCGGVRGNEGERAVEEFDPQVNNWEPSDLVLPFKHHYCYSFICPGIGAELGNLSDEELRNRVPAGLINKFDADLRKLGAAERREFILGMLAGLTLLLVSRLATERTSEDQTAPPDNV